MDSVGNTGFVAGTMPGRLMDMETKLQRLASNLVSSPGKTADIALSVNEISTLVKAFENLKDLPPEPVQIEALVSAVRGQLSRVHLLLESALVFHSGSLLSTPPVEETYTPEGKWQTAAAGANLSLQA